MFSTILNADLMASHTMPSLIPKAVETATWCGIVPIVLAALLGAKVLAHPFRWKRVMGATLGTLAGILSIIPTVIASFLLVYYLARVTRVPEVVPFELTMIALIYLITSSIAYVVGLIGRPAREGPILTMTTLDENLDAIDIIVRNRLQQTNHVTGTRADINVAMDAGALSFDQATRLKEIVRKRNQFENSRSVMHADVALWAGRSIELRNDIVKHPVPRQELANANARDDEPENPYRPPAPDTVST